MTEKEWLQGTDPQTMLDWLTGKAKPKSWLATLFVSSRSLKPIDPRRVSLRKLRLFACACCEPIWELLVHDHSRNAVHTAEQFADGSVGVAELARAHTAAVNSWQSFQGTIVPMAIMPEQMSVNAFKWAAYAAVAVATSDAVEAAEDTERAVEQAGLASLDEGRDEIAQATRARPRAALLREIIGNPFAPVPSVRELHPDITALAEAHYSGTDCAFALADALQENGHEQLAEHFRVVDWHPRGCWAVDLILGKE